MENEANNRWFESIDIYCERLSADFWAEPINAISNIFFIIAGIIALNLWRKSAARTWDVLVMALLMLVVGTGSFIFHTVATRWAGLADVLPIAIFIHFSFGVFLYRVANAGLLTSMLGVFIFGLYSVGIQKIIPVEFMNRSGQYAGAVTLLLAISIYCFITNKPAAKYFGLAFFTFVISLTLRSMDMAICESFPYGIHYMWHILNSIVMYLVFRAVLTYSHVSIKA